MLHEGGKDTAHYVDAIGFEEVPAFFKQEPDRFRYYITEDATRHGTYPYMDETDQTHFTSQLHKYEQGAITAYGYLEYSKPLTPEQEKAYALIPSPQNHLETVEKTEEQNLNHIDGILNNLPTEEAAVSIDGGSLYLSVQTCDSGYDYTFFNGAFEELDGGQLDNPELSMAQAVYELLADEGWEQAKLEALDYDFLMEQAEAAERDKHIRMQAMAYVQEPEVLRVVPVGRFERYIEPSEVTQDQYLSLIHI